MKALSLHITGIVQGVGFRPFVYNLATGMGLSGWVLNSSDGVFCVVEGDAAVLDEFARRVRDEAPAMAMVEHVHVESVDPEHFDAFEIRESSNVEGAMTLVSPDIATCELCATELADSGDRRFRYPFINCTNCGPRFTIIEDIPYDRPLTTMRDFPMCPECAAEYADPGDRRFHAQPDACFVCGPRLYLNISDGDFTTSDLPDDSAWAPDVDAVPRPHRNRDAEKVRSDSLIDITAELILQGGIVALKGLGGFHLACDATNQSAVSKLRERKHRWGKPLAIMVRTIDEARRFCEIGEREAGLLESAVRPIVLLRLSEDNASPIAPAVCAGLAEIGVMLPYTPLHHLLLEAVDRPLVMTSGNLSEEPIATGNAEALERLGGIADGFLLHDREIYSRYDDSVVRVVGEIEEPVRRARGYAPHPLKLPFTSDIDILATGPEQKNTFTLLSGEYAFVSQHIGDMENAETLEHYERTIELYSRLFRIEPRLIAYDLHPEYLSTKFAMGLGLPKIGVQHHHAHVVSVTAEHGVAERVVGISFDGTGYGSDGTLWGGEVLLADWSGFERFAHLRHIPLPGGVAAIRRPARMAVSTLHALGLLDHPGAAPLRSRLAEGEERLLLQMIERQVNSPLTSSIGRLFDSVAAIIGVRDDAAYEGQAAIELEAAADPAERGEYEFALLGPAPGDGSEKTCIVIDPAPVVKMILDELAGGIPIGVISMRFHRAVIRAIVEIGSIAAKRTGTRYVALAGGVFMNRILLGEAMRDLSASGLSPLAHVKLPMNDGAVSFGQAIVAWSNRHEV